MQGDSKAYTRKYLWVLGHEYHRYLLPDWYVPETISGAEASDDTPTDTRKKFQCMLFLGLPSSWSTSQNPSHRPRVRPPRLIQKGSISRFRLSVWQGRIERATSRWYGVRLSLPRACSRNSNCYRPFLSFFGVGRTGRLLNRLLARLLLNSRLMSYSTRKRSRQ